MSDGGDVDFACAALRFTARADVRSERDKAQNAVEN